jgi:hypothetical protein
VNGVLGTLVEHKDAIAQSVKEKVKEKS